MTQLVTNTIKEFASTIVAGDLRRSRIIPTQAFVAYAGIQAAVTSLTQKALEMVQGRFRVFHRVTITPEQVEEEIYIISKVASIFLTYLALKGLSALTKGRINLKYDMNPGSVSAYDIGSIFCIVAQTVLVTKAAEKYWIRHNLPPGSTRIE